MARSVSRLSLLVMLVWAAVGALAATAHADAPVAGGTYLGSASFGQARCAECLTLNVANDGGEFSAPSGVELDWRMPKRADRCPSFVSLSDLSIPAPPVSATIGPDGGFDFADVRRG